MTTARDTTRGQATIDGHITTSPPEYGHSKGFDTFVNTGGDRCPCLSCVMVPICGMAGYTCQSMDQYMKRGK